MCEIEFRIWFKDRKYMEYFRPTSEFKIALNGDVFFGNELIPDFNVVIMQYTGRKDKNDKKIFEGDKVKVDNNEGVVRYGNCSFVVFFPKLQLTQLLSEIAEVYSGRFEIIGNTYED